MKVNPLQRKLAILFLPLSLGSAPSVAVAQVQAETPPPAITPSLTPSVMHMTIPGEVGKPAKEGWVQPSGQLQTDADGNLVTSRQTANPTPGAAGGKSSAKPQGTAVPFPIPSIPVGPAPQGKAVATGANTASIRGTVKVYEAGKLLTMTVKGTGKDITYTLKPDAKVPANLKAGDSVRIRVLTAEKGKVADRVEIIPKQ